MPDAPGPDIAAQIDVVREAHTSAVRIANSYTLLGGPFLVDIVRRDVLAAALRTLEAAQAWAEQLRPWMGCSIPYDSQSETAKLYRAIMGKTP